MDDEAILTEFPKHGQWLVALDQARAKYKITEELKATASPPFRASLSLSPGTIERVSQQLNIQLQSEYTSSKYSKKKHALAHVAKDLVGALHADEASRLELEKTLGLQTTTKADLKTPKQLLEEFRFKHGGSITDIQRVGNEYSGSLTVDGITFTVSCPYSVNQSQCRHDIATALLLKAAFPFDDAWEAYKTISKERTFFKGRIFGKPEGQVTEFKGHQNAEDCMVADSVVTILSRLGEEICSFLNAEGGSLYVGVHDTGVIQGIDISHGNRDPFLLRIKDSITKKLDPIPTRCLRFDLHEVKIFSPTPDAPLPPRPANPDPYTLHIESELQRLKDHMSKQTVSKTTNIGNLYILECFVQPSPELIFYDSRPYIREGAAKRPLTIAEIKTRIIADYLKPKPVPPS